ncbi:hypothetical protein [Fulvimarina sp. MAC3]|uniref:hypothetical protein n=1 Tax=Fulvimarina sp. MAC3 TaxID=3148887 RepID=UPI0031FC317A
MTNKTVWSLVVVGLSLNLAVSPAQARSKAADWLVQQQIAEACDSGGTIDTGGVIERDLDGDGAADLIIAHDSIRCSNGRMSSFCGMQVCSVEFYLRRGKLLKNVGSMLGSGVEVEGGRVPKIFMNAHGGSRGSVRWNGTRFR